MKCRLYCVVGAVAALLAIVTVAGAETCKLELKQVDESSEDELQRRYSDMSISPQEFSMRIGEARGMVDRPAGATDRPKFSDAIRKEPADYATKHPFRGVVKLGSQYYGLVFDVAPAEPPKKGAGKKQNEKAEASEKAANKKLLIYSRLYFDFNRNGDLTDDKVVEAEEAELIDSDFAYSLFPRVNVKIKSGGASVDYAFAMTVYAYEDEGAVCVEGALQAGVFRVGELTLGGRERLVILADSNSNGVFDDTTTVSRRAGDSGERLEVIAGDRLCLIDRRAESDASGDDEVEEAAEHYVAALSDLNGVFYDLRVTPSGDQISFSPSVIPVGYVTNPNKRFEAVVYGDRGFFKIVADEEGRAALPEGEWRVLSYEINRTGFEKLERQKPEVEDKNGKVSKSFLNAFLKAVTPSFLGTSDGATLVSAEMTKVYSPVKVTSGKTTRLPFGPPYRPVVSVEYIDPENGEASLGITLVGTAGEECDYVLIKDRRPGKPKFTITTEDGKKVAGGTFEYG